MDNQTFCFQYTQETNAPPLEEILTEYEKLKEDFLSDLVEEMDDEDEEEQQDKENEQECISTDIFHQQDNKLLKIVFGENVQSFTLDKLHTWFSEITDHISKVEHFLKVKGVISGTESPVENISIRQNGMVEENHLYYLNRIREVVEYSYESLYSSTRLAYSRHTNRIPKDFKQHPHMTEISMGVLKKKYRDHQQLLQRLGNRIRMRGLMYHIHGKLIIMYRPIINEMGYNTHAYEPMLDTSGEQLTLEKWVEMNTKDGPNRLLCESGTGNFNWVTRMLERNERERIYIYKPNRYVFSFNDGIYLVNVQQAYVTAGFKCMNPAKKYVDKFILYGSAEHKTLSKKFVAVRYMDRSFVGLGYDYDLQIPTPNFDRILKYQWGERDDYLDIYESMCMCIGNLLYPIGSVNKWDRTFYLLGKSKCGKSKIINILFNIYGIDHTMIISNNFQKGFGWYDIRGKFLAVATEVDQNFGADECEMKAALTGERVAIREKFNPITHPDEIKTHIVMAGNSKPRSKDKSCAMSRRIMVFYFHRPVLEKDRDTYMDTKLELELPYIIIKCNRIFLRKLRYSDIHKLVPTIDYHKETDLMCELQDNSLLDFLFSNEKYNPTSSQIRFGEGLKCTLNEFLRAYHDYCRIMHSIRIDTQNKISLDTTIDRYNSMTSFQIRFTNERNRRYVEGVAIVTKNDDTNTESSGFVLPGC